MSDWIYMSDLDVEPVGRDVKIDVLYRDGDIAIGVCIGDDAITENGEECTIDFDSADAMPIIAYRLHKPKKGGILLRDESDDFEVVWPSIVVMTSDLAEAVKKRDKHRAKLDKWAGEVERLKGELEREIVEATGLSCRIGETDTNTDEIAVRLWKLDQAVEHLRREFRAWDQVGVPSGSIMRVSDDEPGNVWQHPNGDTSPVDDNHALNRLKETGDIHQFMVDCVAQSAFEISADGNRIKVGDAEYIKSGDTYYKLPEGVDPDDPATWKAGDVVECVESSSCCVIVGDMYEFLKATSLHIWIKEDNEGDENGFRSALAKFRFVRRPS